MVKEVIGLQYGDEGKGRATHFEAQNADIVIRCTGGNNAGHTVVAKNKKYAMHLLPSAIIRPEIKCIIAPGVVVDPEVLISEAAQMILAGVKITPENLVISDRAHLILEHHKQLDKFYESLKKNKVGTTGRGIGPTYEEKCRRTNLRMADLLIEEDKLMEKLEESLKVYQKLTKGNEEFPEVDVEQLFKKCMIYKEELKTFIGDSQQIINRAIQRNENIILEGAQALYLDLDHGDYPMVTSSSPNASGTASGAGIGPTLIDEVIGVMKAYTSRVGEGPFITEQKNEVGDRIRDLGHEYGTTTGRPRRCGWLDLVMIKNAKYINGITSLCVNHVDTIGKLPTIQVCIGYEYKGQTIDYVPTDRNSENCRPIYREFKGGWDTTGAKTYSDLPKEAREYLDFIESFTEIPIKYVGIGADEKQTIVRY